VNDDRTYDIKFDDGDRKKCVTEDQLKVDGGTSSGAQPAAVGKKERKKGDRVRAKCKGWNKYYGGEIIHVDSRNGTFSIKFDDGERKAGVTEEELEQTVEDPGYKVGDRIEAKCKGWTKYFAGNITHDHGNGTYDLSFDDGDKKKKVPHTQIKLAPPKPKPKKRKQVMNYKVGDRVEAKATGWKEHYQGEINAVDDEEGVYTIHFDDGEKKNDIQEFQVRKILTEVYAVGDVVDVKCPGWSRHYRGKVEYVNPNRTYNIQFEDGELKRGVRTIEIKGKSSGSSLSGLSETAEAKLKAWSTDEKLVGDFIAKVIDMVGDEDFIPRFMPSLKGAWPEDKFLELPNDTQLEQYKSRKYYEDGEDDPTWTTDLSLSLSTFCTIVVETDITNKMVNISEKTIRALALGQPMLLLGVSGTHQYLKDLGFDLLDDIIDNSFDQEPETYARFCMFSDSIDKINTHSIGALHHTKCSVKDRLRANRTKVEELHTQMNKRSKEIIDEVLLNFNKHMNIDQ